MTGCYKRAVVLGIQVELSEPSHASVVSSSAGFFAYPARFKFRPQRHVTRTTLGRGRSVDSEMFGYTEGSVQRDPLLRKWRNGRRASLRS